MNAVVDSHVHVWDAARADYPWLVETPSLEPAYTLDEFWPQMSDVGVEQVVLVQAADNLADSENMLDTARTHEQVAGVVVWLPLRDPGAAQRLLDGWRHEPIVGVRHLVHRDPDPDLLRDPAVGETLELLGARGLTFDVCAETPALLDLVPGLAERHPLTTFVVDHLGKPPIRERAWQPWAGLLAAAAGCPNVVVKLSGLNTAAGTDWSSADFQPYVDHALAMFGAERVMYGGDWPFARLAATAYAHVLHGLLGTLKTLPGDVRDAVLTSNSRRVYGLAPATERHRGQSPTM